MRKTITNEMRANRFISRMYPILHRVCITAGDPEDGYYCGTCRAYGHAPGCPINMAADRLYCMQVDTGLYLMPTAFEFFYCQGPIALPGGTK